MLEEKYIGFGFCLRCSVMEILGILDLVARESFECPWVVVTGGIWVREKVEEEKTEEKKEGRGRGNKGCEGA